MNGNGYVDGLNGHAPTNNLKIIVIGAGIGGLSAAINLRKQGHDVTIYESSKFATELGAAIHIPPNVYGVLERMGINIPETGANQCAKLTWYTSDGRSTGDNDMTKTSHLWKHPWVLGHRITLHNALKDTALKLGAELKLSSPVATLDPVEGTVELRDGSKDSADVIVGADGVHSVSRKYVRGGDRMPYSSGKSAFRFLIPRQKVLDDPQTAKYAQEDGILAMIMHPDRRMVMYSTSNNTLLNFVCIHPEEETAADSSGEWNNKATKEMLLNVHRDFHEDFRAILAKADEDSLKLWRLMDMDTMENWTEGRLALLGDAVHPFLPHQGQGGAVAIEDAMALGIVLEKGVTRDQVRERLELYQQIRQERANKLQHFTRLSGEDLAPGQTAKVDYQKITAYNFGFDEFDNSTQRLREWKWSKQPASYWRMPVGFGPAPGPRQRVDGQPRDGTNSTFVTSSIKFKTSRTVLQNLFPPGSKSWRFASPATVATASISQTTLDGMEWLGGKGYNFLCLFLHGIVYTNERGEEIHGMHLPFIAENLADPVITGRDELGMPKLVMDIDKTRGRTTQIVKTSWRGAEWGTFEWEGLEEVPNAGKEGMMGGIDAGEGILAARYFPAVGRKNRGQPDVQCVVLDRFADSTPKPNIQRILTAKNASISISAGDEKSLPTLHYITSRLAEIPIYEILEARIVEGTGVADLSHLVQV